MMFEDLSYTYPRSALSHAYANTHRERERPLGFLAAASRSWHKLWKVSTLVHWIRKSHYIEYFWEYETSRDRWYAGVGCPLVSSPNLTVLAPAPEAGIVLPPLTRLTGTCIGLLDFMMSQTVKERILEFHHDCYHHQYVSHTIPLLYRV